MKNVSQKAGMTNMHTKNSRTREYQIRANIKVVFWGGVNEEKILFQMWVQVYPHS